MKINWKIFIAMILILLAGYLTAFALTKRATALTTFDNIMSEDTAQIARNTVNGNFFTTKYVTPASYAYFPYLENHPDYIRYPFIILLYAFLFLFAPQSAATIKIFNGFLFLINGMLIFLIALNLLARKKDSDIPHQIRNWLAALAAIFVSFIIEDYFRYALSDAYEIPTITVLLLLILVVSHGKAPALAGALQAVLYLCRPNMVVFASFIWIYLAIGKETFKEKLRVTLIFSGAFVFILAPFLVRNMILTGKVMFSYQQLFELYKNATADHNELYNNFSIAQPLFPITRALLSSLYHKFLEEVVKPFIFASQPEYWLGWIGIPFFFLRFKNERRLLLLILLSLITHIVVFSLYLQLDRVYVPLFFLASIFGYLGVFEWIISIILKRWEPARGASQNMLILLLFIFCAACFTVVHPRRPERDNRARPPSAEAVAVLQQYDLDCVYSNNPYWIAWYADIVAIYKPTHEEDIFTKGPENCRYFIVDERKPYPNSFLRKYGIMVDKGEDYSLFILN